MNTYRVIVFKDYKVSEAYEVFVEANTKDEAMSLAEQEVESESENISLFGDISRFDLAIEADENSIHCRNSLSPEQSQQPPEETIMKFTSKDLIGLVQRHALTGTVIDVSEMEGSGGGRYPSFRAVKGRIDKVLSEDFGEQAYDLMNLSVEDPSQVPDDTYAFYYGYDNEGFVLLNLKTGKELTLKMQQ